MVKDDPKEHWTDLKPKNSLISGKTDDKIEDKNTDPQESMMSMMKDLYNNGDAKTKAMIAESW